MDATATVQSGGDGRLSEAAALLRLSKTGFAMRTDSLSMGVLYGRVAGSDSGWRDGGAAS